MKPFSSLKHTSGKIGPSEAVSNHQYGMDGRPDFTVVIISIAVILFVVGVVFYVVQHLIVLLLEYKKNGSSFFQISLPSKK